MKRFLLVLFILQCCFLSGRSQSVGLVLSGGGAKGLAHIAVIRALEENGIPIDYVAGTSMGAIVAGLYAAGYTPDEMEELFKSDQFKFWTTGKIQEEYRYFYRKLEDDPSWMELNLLRTQEKLKILPPSNLIPEEQMDFAFMELFSDVTAACKRDFNQLFVPYFCVATDVFQSSEIVFRNGDLGEAIRGSMTFPFYFKPIEINGSLVFDGGIVNNFPVKEMKEIFEPDIIIGHNVANNPEKPDADNLMVQIENMIMKKTDYQIDPKDGFLMETTFDNVGLLDFKKIDIIEGAGYQTVMNNIDSIRGLISRRIDPAVVSDRRNEFNKKKPPLLFQNVQVEGVADDMQRKFLIQSIRHNSEFIDLKELKSEYFKLVADQQIKSIRPVSRYNEETGYFDLHLIVKPNNPMQIKFGGNISTRPISQGFLSADYRLFKDRSYTLSTNMYFGRFYSSFKAGARIDFPTTVPYYLAAYLSFNRWDYYSSTTEFVFEDVRPPYIIQYENSLRAELGFPLNTRAKFVLGGSLSSSKDKYYLTESIKASDTPDNTSFDAVTVTASVQSNTFNDKQYPTEGISSYLSFNYISGKEKNNPGTTSNEQVNRSFQHDFYLLKASYDRYFKVSRHFSAGLLAEGVFSNKKVFSNYVATTLAAPSFNPVPHSKTIYLNNFHANKYVASGAKAIVRFSDWLHFRAECYGFLPVRGILETGNFNAVYSPERFPKVRFMGTTAFVFESALGPVSLSVSYYDKSQTRFFGMLNFGYILFNKRGY